MKPNQNTTWILSQCGPTSPSPRTKPRLKAGGVASLLVPLHESHPTSRWLHRKIRDDESAEISSLHFSGRRSLALELPESIDSAFIDEFCNGGLWPLFHGLLERCRFSLQGWRGYVEANRLFAKSLAQLSWKEASPVFLIQDFHFALVPRMLRALERAEGRPRSRISVFWHIHWPDTGLLEILPWTEELLDGICDADVLFFQTRRDELNFRALLRTGSGIRARRIPRLEVLGATLGHERLDGNDPSRNETNTTPRDTISGTRRILGVDRIDYTKGILHKLQAFLRLAERNPEPESPIEYIQIGAPCRESCSEFVRHRREIESAVADLKNRLPARYRIEWRPTTHSQDEIRELSRASDVGWVTPLRDGMNLFAQEFIAAQAPDSPGVLVLSRFAGVAQALRRGVISVNPWFVDEMAEALSQALTLTPEERCRLHGIARRELDELSANNWGERLIALTLGDEPEVNPASQNPLKISAS